MTRPGAARVELFCALSTALLCACGQPTPRELAATTSYRLARDHGRYRAADGLQLFSIEVGSGPEVVLLHGNPTSTYTWREIVRPLAQRYRVYAFDFPGFGFSDKPRDASYSTSWLASVVDRYMKAVGIESAILVGSSMGGEIAAEVAVLYAARVRGLVLLAPTGLAIDAGYEQPFLRRLAAWPGLGAWLARLPARRFVRRSLARSVHDPATHDEADIDAYYDPLRSVGGMIGFLGRAGQRPSRSRDGLVRQIRAPTAILVGDHDRRVERAISERYRALIAGSRLKVLERTGHLPQEERPRAVIAEIDLVADAASLF